MTSLLVPSYEITLGNQRWTSQALSVDLRLEAAPLLDVLTVSFPAAAPLKAAVGDDARVHLASGESDADVFGGQISSIRRTGESIRVTAHDAGGALAAVRPAVTYEQIAAGNVVRNLCDDSGVDTSEIEDGPTLAFYVADPSRTAWEHVARLCAWSGAMARVNADNELEVVVINGAQSDVALRYGRELFETGQSKFASSIDDFVVAGEGGAGDASSADALRPSADTFAGNRPDGPGSGSLWSFEPALRTAQSAATAGAARKRLYGARRERGTFDAFLQPSLRPGTVFEIQELPGGMTAGPFWVEGVRHHVAPDTTFTHVRFAAGGSGFDPAALLGSLVSAIGSLI